MLNPFDGVRPSAEPRDPTRPIEVAVVHHRATRSVRNFSGTLLFSTRAVGEALGQLVDLSPAPIPLWPFRVARRVAFATTGVRYDYDHDPALARFCGRYFSRRVAETRPDLVFSPAGSPSVAHLETDVPIIYFTDGPWSVIRDYNPAYMNVTRRTARAAEELERKSLERAAIVLVSSEWARDAAIVHYGIDPAKVHDVGIGANVVETPPREQALRRELGPVLRLLMVAVDWQSKGGPIAVDALHSLRGRGFDAELTVVGCSVPSRYRSPHLHVVPFLDKSKLADNALFRRLWDGAHIHILPTRAEAAGVVFCEAAANGIPSVATDTGGVRSMISEGRNGFLLPLSAGGTEYADVIAKLVSDPDRYAALRRTSRDEYESRLNWSSWGARLRCIVEREFPLLAARMPGSGSPPSARPAARSGQREGPLRDGGVGPLRQHWALAREDRFDPTS
jgi:glycosyltransferase involved in cell wall biosynthesis